MKKYFWAVFIIGIWFLSAVNVVYGRYSNGVCGDYIFPKREWYPQNAFGKFINFTTALPTFIVYITFSGSVTTGVLSDCDTGVVLETREKLYFLAFSGRHMMQETGRRSGEYADALTEILGCTQERDKFFESAAGHHTDIFRENEYGLSYAVRLNRLLDAEGLCRETPVRSFLREADLTLSASNASFPALP